MKKFSTILVVLILFFVAAAPLTAQGAEAAAKTQSRFYFLQSWGESIKLFLTFSKEKKIDYLIKLSDKRVEELNNNPLPAVANRYQEHSAQIEQLAIQVKDKSNVIEKIKEASLRQQAALTKVYNQVPEQAKEAILNAQENSSKNTEKTIEVIEGPQKAQEYIQEVAKIKQAEPIGQTERVAPVPMESSPAANPAETTPKELKNLNPLMPSQELKTLNPTNSANEGQENGSNKVQPIAPAAPMPMQAPAVRN